MVTGSHIYSNGGVGETEMFHGPGTTTAYLTDRSAESCASYNMLRLTGGLFPYTMDGRMMDYYDNTLRNHILASCSHTSDGGTTYFLPLRPGGQKEYSTTENTCCHGTGMESRFRYMEHIYAYDEQFLYVNLWIDSVLYGKEDFLGVDLPEKKDGRWNERKNETGDFLLSQETIEPREIRIRIGRDLNRKLRLRIPCWACEKNPAGKELEDTKNYISEENHTKEGYLIQVNGENVSGFLKQGYFTIPESCRAGDEIRIYFPMKLRVVEESSGADFVCLAFGPYLLAALSEEPDYIHLPKLSAIEREGDSLNFRTGTLQFIPLAQVDQERYHVYFFR